MIASLTMLAAAAAAATPEQARFEDCVAKSERDPAAAIALAEAWKLEGGGVPARQCMGIAYAAQGKWPSARLAFEQAAEAADRAGDGRAAALRVQAGNAALAGRDAAGALPLFDAAIASGVLKGAELGEARLDRARALGALGRRDAARADLDAALSLVPEDPLGWLLSATLARMTGDLSRAQKDIAEAMKRSPDDASVALEAGNIAISSGAEGAARTAWSAAVKAAPDSPAGKAAAESLARLGARN